MFSKHVIATMFSVPLMIVIRYISQSIPWAPTGFFCDDNEIRYPIRQDTIPGNTMFTIFGIIAVVMFVLTETSLVRHLSQNGRKVRRSKNKILAPVIENLIFLFCSLSAGDLATSAVTTVGKRTMSRPRPNFIAVCQPNLAELCKTDTHQFIENYACQGEDRPDEYFSFPSGHSSHAVFFGVFMIMYLQKRCKFLEPLRSIAQCMIAILVFFICMSRVRDFKHRLSDVTGGAIVGGIVGIFFVKYVLDFFRHARYETVEHGGYQTIQGVLVTGGPEPALSPSLLPATIKVDKKSTRTTSDYGSVVGSEYLQESE